jgi:hypothetical protein
MSENNKPEARRDRDLVPIGGSEKTDSVADIARSHVCARDGETLPPNPIGDTIADVFGAPGPPRDPFAETTPIPDPFGEPQEVDEVDSVPERTSMAARLDALRKDREAAREF